MLNDQTGHKAIFEILTSWNKIYWQESNTLSVQNKIAMIEIGVAKEETKIRKAVRQK